MTRSTFAIALLVLSAGLVTAAGEAGRPRAPRLLSQTGLYADADLNVDPKNRPFSPQYPLWSDGAVKSRWVRLPDAATIDATDVDKWTFPVGTRFWKEFAFGGRRVETRMLWKAGATGWVYASYVWNDAQTDAELAPEAGVPNVAEVAPGKRHTIPGVEDCRACHESGRTEILGFSALQLSTDRDPNAIHGEPLTNDMVSLRTLVEERRLSPGRPELVTAPPRIHTETEQSRAVLGYLSTNCGSCHNPSSTLANLGLNFKQPAYSPTGSNVATETAIARITKWDLPGTVPGTSRALVPGSADHSALLVRMRSRRPSSQMPPLGTVVPDSVAIQQVGDWIARMNTK